MQDKINKIVQKIVEDQVLSDRLLKLDSENEIYNFFVEIGGDISREEFDQELEQLLSRNKLGDADLNKVSGGNIGNTLKKSTALAMGALVLGNAATPPAEALSTRAKIAIGVGATVTLGGAILAACTLPPALIFGIPYIKDRMKSKKGTTETNNETKKDDNHQYELLAIKIGKSNGDAAQCGRAFYEVLKEMNSAPADKSGVNPAQQILKDLNLDININNIPDDAQLAKFTRKILTKKDVLSKLPGAFFSKALAETPNETPISKNNQVNSSKAQPQQQSQPQPQVIDDVPCGIRNPGLNCFANAALQLLNRIPEIRNGEFKNKDKLKEIAMGINNDIKKSSQEILGRLSELQNARIEGEYERFKLGLDFAVALYTYPDSSGERKINNGSDAIYDKVNSIKIGKFGRNFMSSFEDYDIFCKEYKNELVNFQKQIKDMDVEAFKEFKKTSKISEYEFDTVQWFSAQLMELLGTIANDIEECRVFIGEMKTVMTELNQNNRDEIVQFIDNLSKNNELYEKEEALFYQISQLETLTKVKNGLREKDINESINKFFEHKSVVNNFQKVIEDLNNKNKTPTDRIANINALLQAIGKPNTWDTEDFGDRNAQHDAREFIMELSLPDFLVYVSSIWFSGCNKKFDKDAISSAIRVNQYEGKYNLFRIDRAMRSGKVNKNELLIPEHIEGHDLLGAIKHTGGTIRSGHYVAVVKGSNGKWYECDDSSVTEYNSFDEVEKLSRYESCSKCANALLYGPSKK